MHANQSLRRLSILALFGVMTALATFPLSARPGSEANRSWSRHASVPLDAGVGHGGSCPETFLAFRREYLSSRASHPRLFRAPARERARRGPDHRDKREPTSRDEHRPPPVLFPLRSRRLRPLEAARASARPAPSWRASSSPLPHPASFVWDSSTSRPYNGSRSASPSCTVTPLPARGATCWERSRCSPCKP